MNLNHLKKYSIKLNITDVSWKRWHLLHAATILIQLTELAKVIESMTFGPPFHYKVHKNITLLLQMGHFLVRAIDIQLF